MHDATPPPREGTGLALATIALASALVVMDATIANVALPSVIEDLRLDASHAQWMNAGYALVFAALLLTVGRVGDARGRRRILTAGMGLFMLASLAVGWAQGPDWLIVARFAQGLGAAMIMPTALSTMNALFHGRRRGIAFAVYGSTIGGMAAVGPLLGGWLATSHSWRWAFWVNLPVGLAVLAGIRRAIPETRDPEADSTLDPLGALLSALAMGATVFALIEGPQLGWWRAPEGGLAATPFVILLAVAAALAFVLQQRGRTRGGRSLLVDPGLLADRRVRNGVIAAGIVSFGELGLMFTLPLLLQGTLGYSALGAGWLLASLAVGAFLVSGATHPLTQRFGQRAVVRAGLVLEALAVACLAALLSLHIQGAVLAAALFVYGMGVGLATAQLSALILSGVAPAQGGQASGVQSTVRQLGAALGVAVLGTLLVTTLGRGTDERLAEAGVPAQQRERVVALVSGSAGAAIRGLPEGPVADAAREAMVSASRRTTAAAALALGLGVVLTLTIPEAAQGRRSGGPDSDTHNTKLGIDETA